MQNLCIAKFKTSKKPDSIKLNQKTRNKRTVAILPNSEDPIVKSIGIRKTSVENIFKHVSKTPTK